MRHQAQALAATGIGAGETIDALTALTVEQIQQQAFSILLQAAQSQSPRETRTAADTAQGLAGAVAAGKELGEKSASELVDGETKTLTINVRPDSTVELDETYKLRVRAESGTRLRLRQ